MAVDIEVVIKGDDKALKAINQLDSAEKRRKKNFEELNKQAQSSSASYANSVRNSTNETNKLAGVAKKVGGVLAAAFAVQQLVSFGKEVLQTTAKFQKFEAVLTNTLGGKSAARKALAEIQKFASETPFQVDELTDSFIKLANRGFVPTTKELSKLGDLASSTGKSFDQLTEALLDATVGEFERLKEFGVRASKEGENVKFTFKGVQTQVKGTEEEIRKYILSLGNLQGVSGSMAAISRTLTGQISNLQDSFSALQLAIGERLAGALSRALGGFGGLIKAATDFLKIPVSAKLTEEKNTLNALFGAIQNTNKGSEERRILIGRINAIAPELIKNVNLETASNKVLQSTLISVNKEYDKKIFLQATEEKQVEFAKKRADIFLAQADALQRVEERTARINKLEKRDKLTGQRDDVNLGNARIQQQFDKDQIKFNEEKIKTLLKQETDFLNKVSSAKKIAGITDDVASVQDADKTNQETVKSANKTADEILEIQKRAIEQQITLLTSNANLRKEQLNAEKIGYEEQRNLVNQIFVIESQIARIRASQEGTQAAFLDLQTEELKLARERVTALNAISNLEKIKFIQIQEDKLSSVKTFIDKSLNQELNAAAKKREAERKEADLSVSIQQEKWAKIGNITETASQFLGQISSGLFNADSQRRQNELANIEENQRYKLGLVGDNAQAQAFIQEEADNKRRIIQNKQAKADRQKALFDVFITTAVNVVKALGTPPVPNFGAAAIAGGAGLLQGAAIASVPLPKFKDGVESLKRGKNPHGVDTIPILANEGERIVPTHINKLMGKISNDDLPVMVRLAKDALAGKSGGGVSADALRTAFSQALRERPLTVTNFDKDGVSSWVVAENSKTKILNNDNSF